MSRFFIDKDTIDSDKVTIYGKEARHIGKVLRMKIDDPIALFDRNGTVYNGVITSKDSRTIYVTIVKRISLPESNNFKIVLAQAVPKAKKMDLILQKSTELGVSEIIPFFSLRSITRFDEKKSRDKLRHWQQVVIEAVKQSGVQVIPSVLPVMAFKDLVIREYSRFLKIILWEEESSRKLRTVLSENNTLRDIIFIVGPEGGFSREEVKFAQENGFVSVSLGAAVLRTETVSLAVLSIIRYMRGELG